MPLDDYNAILVRAMPGSWLCRTHRTRSLCFIMAWVGNCPLNEGKRSNRTQRSCAAVGTGQRRVGPAGSAPALSRSALRWQRENYVYIADGVHAPAHTWQRAARALPGAPARAPGEPLDLARTT